MTSNQRLIRYTNAINIKSISFSSDRTRTYKQTAKVYFQWQHVALSVFCVNGNHEFPKVDHQLRTLS